MRPCKAHAGFTGLTLIETFKRDSFQSSISKYTDFHQGPEFTYLGSEDCEICSVVLNVSLELVVYR